MSKADILSERRSKLSPAKRALLEKWTRGGFTAERHDAIPRRPAQGPVPLSFAQQRLWFLDQLVPGSPAYTIPTAVRLTGKLHVAVLERSLNEIIRRHEALRTTFPAVDGQPSQVIAPRLSLSLPVVDLQKLPETEREAEALRLATEEAQRPFDLGEGPLVRATLLRLSEEECVFLLAMHHIISDGWAMGVFIHEMVALYKAFCAGKPSPLPELPVQYADFAYWQREWLRGERLEAQLAYWKDRLGDNPPALQLLGDRPRPAVQTFEGASRPFEFPPALLEALKALSQQERVTLFMTLLAGFKTLLHRYTGQCDILVGTPIANRNRVELEGLIGFFTNTLVLRTDLSGNPSFRELLARVRDVALGAYAHQDLPFEQLVEELQPKRDMSRTPLFQVMLVLQNAPMQALEIPGLAVRPVEAYTQAALFDLWVSMWEEAGKLRGLVQYSTDIFDDATITRMLDHFQTLLTSIVADPDQRLSDLTLLSALERQQLLVDWNETTTRYPQGQCLHHLVEAQVARTPDAVAVVFEDEHLTYRELNRRANQLARYLRALGVGPDVLVGICVERSLEMVVGLLGALKAGGAYVPLDPTYPRERLAFVMADAQVPVLLTQQRLMRNLPGHTAEVVCLDSDWRIIRQESQADLTCEVTADNLAYVIYTSGSTGKPKGAMDTHRGICNRLLWMQDTYRLTEADHVLQKTPFSFDVSVWEFFWPLLTGASLVVARPEGHKDSAYLVNLIAQQGITTLHFVPSMLQVFLEEKGLEACTSLRRVICSGEALPFTLQERFFDRLDAELHNLYGPTEAAVDVTFWPCRRGSQRRVVPIGRPIANTQIYLLDRHMNPVPVGVPGELHIGGIGLARGYLNRPELTGEKFVPNPFIGEPGMRLYKTGDRARYLPDGNIEFLGRIDHQVKVRGFRIELGEVEAVLGQHPGLRDVVVVARDVDDAPGHKQLVAYVIPNAWVQGVGAQTAGVGLPAEQVSEWQQVFDRTYSEAATPQDPAFNIAGWNSSFTGLPLAAEEMREWVDRTVERILSLRPGRVLEIGCGTGLLLFRIAPHCIRYWGTDFSSAALGYLRQQLAKPGQELPQVRLFRRTAEDLDGLQDETFDAVVLNSVIQYFPNVDYLLRVLRGAVQMVAPGGFIFVGDVRSLPLLEAFHTSVELARAPSSLSTAQLRRRVRKRISQEQELVIDPAFFFALEQQLPEINHVEIQLRRGRHHNELTRFRYDAILHVGREVPRADDLIWLDWQKERLTPDTLRQMLLETEPEILGITHVLNARLLTAIRSLALMADPDRPETVGELRRALQEADPADAVDPEGWWALGDELPYAVDVRWSDVGTDGCYEVLVRRRTASEGVPPAAVPAWLQETGDRRRPWHSYGNNPLQEKLARQLVPELRSYLKEKLPEYMIPSAFVLVDAWPLTPNGKLDRRALPSPLQAMPEMEEGFVAPRTRVEEILAQVWAEVLGLGQVGVHDNFFELGGDSIHSIQIVARGNRAGVRISPRQLFQNQTIAELAAVASPGVEDRERPEVGPASFAPGKRPDFPLAGLDRHRIDQLLAANPDIEDMYPLAPYQEHMLLHTLSNSEPGLFVWQRMFVLPFVPDIPALKHALRRVVERYPTLRTSFLWEGLDEPLQIVHERGEASLEQQDLRGLSSTEQAQRLDAYAEADRARGFALTEPAGMRVFVAQVAEDACRIILTSSYMRGDGWGAGLILHELFAFYQGFCAGQNLQLERPPLYRDYIAWLRQQDEAEMEPFWRRTFRGFTAPTPLVSRAPGNRPGRGEGFDRQHVYLPAWMTAGLGSLARQHRLTLNTLLQGAWALLLSRYSGLEDVLFGVTVSGRPATLPHVESIAGSFINTLPLRVRVPREESLLPWLKKIMAQQVELSQYEHSRLHRIHEWSQVPESLPLFESFLVFQNLKFESLVLEGLSTGDSKVAHLFYAQMGLPLRVDAFPQAEMGLVLSYYRRYFDADTIARMLKDLQTVLEGFVVNPERCLGELAWPKVE